jgi:hypothetical protein
MKKILTILFAFLTLSVAAQNTHQQSNANTNEQFRGTVEAQKGLINGYYPDTVAANFSWVKDKPFVQIATDSGTVWIRNNTATKWIKYGGGSIIPAGAITTIPVVGTNPGTNLSSDDWIINTFYGSQSPTATLTGGQTLELQSAATLTKTLSWTAGRQSATNPLSTIVVAGTNETFSQPAQGASVSGTQSVSFPANTDITYQNVVTTDDSKTATASTTFSFLPKRYYGFISDTTGIGTTGFDDTKITSLGNEINASKVKSWSTGNPTGTQFYVYAYYATAGELSHFDMNGFPSIDAMNHVTRNFTNALGYTGQWTIYWSKNGQTLQSTVVTN